MFDIYQYSEMLARSLKAVNHTDRKCQYYEATEQTELQELEQNISNASGTILIAIDGQVSNYSFMADNLIELPTYSIVIAKQTKATNAQSVTIAQKQCKQIIDQVIAKILCDAHHNRNDCNMVDADTFTTEGFGPIGGLFYGVILSFTVKAPRAYNIKENMWL